MADLHAEITHLEEQIADLTENVERCRKLVLLGRAVAWLGGLGLALFLAGVLGRSPVALVLALAALVGGVPFAGANLSTLAQIRAAIQDAEERRRGLIDALALRAVETTQQLR